MSHSVESIEANGVGRIEAIHIATQAGEPMRPVDRIPATAGVGLEGDRYATARGHWSQDRRIRRDLTLIEAEVIDALRLHFGMVIEIGATRRNMTTRGIRLNALVGRRFRIGTVLCEGTRLCEPCQYLADLVREPILKPLVHRGGLRANILTDGYVQVGDIVKLAS
jgi:MOSC domain-containing protein YiiM